MATMEQEFQEIDAAGDWQPRYQVRRAADRPPRGSRDGEERRRPALGRGERGSLGRACPSGARGDGGGARRAPVPSGDAAAERERRIVLRTEEKTHAPREGERGSRPACNARARGGGIPFGSEEGEARDSPAAFSVRARPGQSAAGFPSARGGVKSPANSPGGGGGKLCRRVEGGRASLPALLAQRHLHVFCGDNIQLARASQAPRFLQWVGTLS